MKYLPLLKEYGIKLTHVGRKLKPKPMSESLIRYHLELDEIDPEIEMSVIELLLSYAAGMTKKLEARKAALKDKTKENK